MQSFGEHSVTLPILGKVTANQLSHVSSIMGKVVIGIVTIAVAVCVKLFVFNKRHKSAKEVVDAAGGQGCMKGKTVLVTGGNSGIGLEACKAFLFAGARVILCSRSTAAAAKAVEEEIKQPGEGKYVVSDTSNLVIKELDLNSLKAIHKFAQDILATEKSLDILVLNAGIMALPKREETEDGFEKQIGVNHFGHAFLGRLLESRLAEGKTNDNPGRVVVLSSIAHNMGTVGDCSDLHYNRGRKYSQWGAYGQSKQANLLFAKYLDEDFKAKKLPLVAISLHPGAIQTKLWKSTGVASGIGAAIASVVLMDKTIPEGASTTVWACLSRDILREDVRGGYLVDCAPASPTTKDAKDVDGKFRKALKEATEFQLNATLTRIGL